MSNFIIEREIDPTPAGMKVCSNCGKLLPVEDFHMQRKGPTSEHRQPTCKACRREEMNARNARIRAEDPDMTLTEEEINGMWQEQEGKCYYSGLDMTLDPGHKETWSVDRVDPSKGYNLENCVLCCSAVNMMKQDFELPEFRRYIAAIYERNSAKEGE